MDSAGLSHRNLFFEERMQDDRCGPAILEAFHGVEMVNERRGPNHEWVRQTQS